MFVRHVGESALTATVWREGEQSRKSGKRDEVDILCCFRVGSCWVFIANIFVSPHQQTFLQSTAFQNSLLVWWDKYIILCCCFFRCTARRWPVRNELFFINGAVDGTSGERFLTITFRISSVKYCVYFLVVCLFFPRSRIDFQKKLDEKHKKQTSCPYPSFRLWKKTIKSLGKN